MNITPYSIAERFLGREEVKGVVDDPQIMAWLRLDHQWPSHDEVPWCSAFVNWICWLLCLPRSKSLRARSWLLVGDPVIYPIRAQKGFDIAVFQRGRHPQPGPGVIDAPGHVGFFLRYDNEKKTIAILGGNQRNKVSVMSISERYLLGIRRLSWDQKQRR